LGEGYLEGFYGLAKKYFYWLLFSCTALTLFSGCTYDVLTKDVLYEIANNPHILKNGERGEPKKPEDIQYYISKKVKLELRETYPELDVTMNMDIL
jgi:hypothetical protein